MLSLQLYNQINNSIHYRRKLANIDKKKLPIIYDTWIEKADYIINCNKPETDKIDSLRKIIFEINMNS
jgi:hypothetical protein